MYVRCVRVLPPCLKRRKIRDALDLLQQLVLRTHARTHGMRCCCMHVLEQDGPAFKRRCWLSVWQLYLAVKQNKANCTFDRAELQFSHIGILHSYSTCVIDMACMHSCLASPGWLTGRLCVASFYSFSSSSYSTTV